MAVTIRETTVQYGSPQDVAQIHISDAPLGDESAKIVLELSVPVGPHEGPALAHVQREAMKVAVDVLQMLIAVAEAELKSQGYPPEPRPAKPRI